MNEREIYEMLQDLKVLAIKANNNLLEENPVDALLNFIELSEKQIFLIVVLINALKETKTIEFSAN